MVKVRFALILSGRNAFFGFFGVDLGWLLVDNHTKGAKMNPKKLTIPSFRPNAYQDFFTPENATLDIAAAVTGSASLLSRNIWRKRLEILGEEAFRNELFLFWSDLRAGEEVRRRERVFTARLNKAIAAAMKV